MIARLQRLTHLRLAPRIVIAILLTIVAAYLFNQVLRTIIPPPPFLIVERNWLVEAVADGVRVTESAPREADKSAFGQLPQAALLDFAISRSVPRAAGVPSSALAEHLRLSVAQRLGGSARLVSVSSAPYDQNYTERTVRTVLVIVPKLPAMLTADTLASRESSVLADFNIVVHLANGRWLTVTQRNLAEPWQHYARVGIGIAGYLLIAIAFSIWMARSIVRPLRRLADAAERLGRSGEATVVDGMRVPEYSAIAETFNTMQLRLSRFIDERLGMLAAISHDLRTPLTRLRLLAEYLETPEQREQLLANVGEMEVMVTDSLAFMRGEVRREASETVDIAALLISITDEFGDLGENIVYSGPDHCDLPGRQLALKRAFSNLVGNGVKYGGSVQLTLRAAEHFAVIDIRDAGPGIPPDQVDRAFAPFVRLESSRSRATGGSGLGLSISRDIVRGHGGDITFLWPTDGFVTRVSLPFPA
ncbi:signal transduction histidine kinase [Sphingomonas sp. UYAg733]